MNPALVIRKRTVPESAYEGKANVTSMIAAARMAAPHFIVREIPNIVASLPFTTNTPNVTPAGTALQGYSAGSV